MKPLAVLIISYPQPSLIPTLFVFVLGLAPIVSLVDGPRSLDVGRSLAQADLLAAVVSQK